MTVGDGIFWGSVCLSLVGLYLGTKDRWRWRRLLGWGGVGVVALAGIVAAGIAGFQWYESRPRQFTGMWGLSLGASTNDVLVAKGEPARRVKPMHWFYEPDDRQRIEVAFTPQGKLAAIYSYAKPLYLTMPEGVSAFTTMEELTARFGPASAVNDSSDGLFRTFSFSRYNLVAVYGEGRLVAIGVESGIDEKGRTFGPRGESSADEKASPK